MINIKNKQKCCGCEACRQTCPMQCIKMSEDEEGFCYPEVKKTICIDCKQCEAVCPILHSTIQNSVDVTSYVAYSCDEQTRLISSSGGLFSIFAKKILKENGVVFGAAFDDSFMVHHIVIEREEELSLLQGSKYLQSRIYDSYKNAECFLKDGRKVLFSGTSCQIAGLKQYLKVKWPNLLTIDVLCHGVPSPKVWKRYLVDQENEYGASVQRTFFRHKKYGWKTYALSLEFSNNKAYRRIFQQDAFMRMFLSNICLRPSCHSCQFKEFPRPSDITLGDCWGVERHSPEMDDNKGTSVVIVNSNKGKEMFEMMRNEMVVKEMPLDMVLPADADSRKSVTPHYNRSKLFIVLNRGEGDLSVLLKLLKPRFFRKIKNKLSNIKAIFRS